MTIYGLFYKSTDPYSDGPIFVQAFANEALATKAAILKGDLELRDFFVEPIEVASSLPPYERDTDKEWAEGFLACFPD